MHAHTFYPPYLILNSEEVPLAGNDGGRTGKTYSHYRIFEEAVRFIKDNRKKPFFCYLPFTPPHGMYDVPATDPAWKLYEKSPWMKDPEVPQDAKNYAVMVSMLDRQVGELMELLETLGLEQLTAFFFTVTTVDRTASRARNIQEVFLVRMFVQVLELNFEAAKEIFMRVV